MVKQKIRKKGAKGEPRRPFPPGDARDAIIRASRSKTVDARDKLVNIARKSDARQKLEKIRNLKMGFSEVKQIGSGSITLTKKLDGKVMLTTKKKKVGKAGEVKRIGHLTQTIKNGKITLSTKSGKKKKNEGGPRDFQEKVGGLREVDKKVDSGVGDTVAARLDQELMAAKIDPVMLKRTIEQGRKKREQELIQPNIANRSSTWGGQERSRGRERSPLSRLPGQDLGNSRYPPLITGPRGKIGLRGRDLREPSPLRRTGAGRLERSPLRRPGRMFDYDDPRSGLERDAEMYKRRMKEQQQQEIEEVKRFDNSGMNGVSPLQGCKVVITNLQTTVTQEDILELFGDIGALRRAKLVNPGHAEVTFVERKFAERAVEVYHNRQLDGKPMKCQLVGGEVVTHKPSLAIKLPQSLAARRGSHERAAPPDVESIHRALFANKNNKNMGKKPLFTITMPKKTKEEERASVW